MDALYPTTTARPAGRLAEGLTLLGILLGLACLASSMATVPPRRLYAAAWPSPEAITAYATAICGAIVTAANTGFFLWHKLREPRRPRRKRRKKADAPHDPPPA